jgi:hypothetical protein
MKRYLKMLAVLLLFVSCITVTASKKINIEFIQTSKISVEPVN